MRTRTWRRRLAALLTPLLALTFISLVPAPANAVMDDCGVAGNLVTNCGFETGDFTSWTKGGDTLNTEVLALQPNTGTYALRAGPMAEGTLTQTLTTVSGQVYDVGVWLSTRGVGTTASDYVIVEVDPDGAGPDGWTSPVVSVQGPGSATYTRSTGTFTASGSQAILRFRYLNWAVYWMIDDISVVANIPSDPIDEPVPSSMIVSYNGLEWVWASPVAADSPLTDGVLVGKDGFNFATPEQWALRPAASAFGGTMCAAPWFDQTWDHCDWGDPGIGYFGSALTGGLPAGADGTVPMDQMGETWLVRVPDSADVETSTGLVSNHDPSVFGQSVVLTATVTPASGPAPTGTVEFWEGASKLDTVTLNASGVATLTVDDFAVGTHNLIAKYVPDTGFTASESALLVQDVNKAATTTTINSVTPASPVYGQSLSFDTTVAPVAPGAGTPTGVVTYEVNKFAGTADATGYQAFDPATDLLPAGTHHVEALYPGDDSFEGSRSDAFVVEVDKAETTVAYLGDYLAILGNSFTFKANVDSPVGTCEAGREVTFTLLDGSTPVGSFTATSGAGGAVTKTVSTTGWPTGEFDVAVDVAGTSNCTTADNAGAMDVVTVASPGDAATGGGWYFWKASGAGKRVNFGFTVSKEADDTYKGSLLLMNQGVWRLKGDLNSYTKTDQTGQAGGTGTLYQWVLADPSDPASGSWQNPRGVSFKVSFSDYAAGKAKGKKGVVVDQFALTNLSVRGSTLPVSTLMNLMGGNIVLR